MKSLREQIDLKLGGKGGRKRSQEKRSVARKPLIVTPTTGVFPSSHQNTRIPTSDRDEDFEKDRHDFLSGVFHREEPNILKGTSSRLIKEDSDVPLRHVWSHSDYQDPETKEEKSNLQLIDKILVKYGSHHGRRTGNKQYQAATEYLNYHIQQDFGSKLPHGKRKQGKTASLHGREKDQASSFEQDADSFPKSYLPIAHTQDEGEDSQFNNSVKVRDVLQKAIRQHLNGSGKKSVRDSNTSSTDQQSLFDAQKMKEILVQRRAINLYQKEGAQSSKGAASAYGSQKPGMRTSPVDEITPQAEASDDQLSDDGYAKKPGFDDHDLGVPVFTYVHKWPQSEKKPARKDGPIVGAFHAHSEELVTGNDPRSQPRSNVFVSRNLNPVQKNYSSIRDGIDDREAYLERERAYTLNQSVHSKRVNVVRAKCPPTNSKLTYTKLYDLRSQLYISNPYGGPKHVQNRLNLINK